MIRTDNTAIYTATKEILIQMDIHGIIYKFEHFKVPDSNEAEYDCISVKFNTENISALNLELLISNNEFVSIKTFSICKARNERLIPLLKLVNFLNKTFSYVKFFVDEDNNLCAEADCSILPSDTDFAQRAIDFVSLYVDILNISYPQIMECVWNKN